MGQVILELGVIILVAAILSIIGRFIKQPPLIGYIVTGIILGKLGFDASNSHSALEIIADFGIILLLFVAGLKIRLGEFFRVGKHSLSIGTIHDVTLGTISLLLGLYLLRLDVLGAIYLGICLSLSSTIVIVKTLTERREIAAPHGQILMGMMLIQDIVAMIALAIFTSLKTGVNPIGKIALTLTQGAFLFITLATVGKYIIGQVFEKIAEHIELVFIFGLAWCFSAVIIAEWMGFSVEIAAFVAGTAIAHLPFSFEIHDKIRPLQDFGLLLFFFTIGATMSISKDIFLSFEFLVLTLLVLIVSPLISAFASVYSGLDKKNGFMVSILPIQVSEFSIIIMAIGLKLGHITQHLFSLLIGIAITTIIISSMVFGHINTIYKKISRKLNFLEWRKLDVLEQPKTLSRHLVLLGFSPLGQYIAHHYRKRKNVVVIDWKPEQIAQAKELGYHVIYGDAASSYVWEEAEIWKADLIVNSTSTSHDDYVNLARALRARRKKKILIGKTHVPKNVPALKRAGYTHVVLEDEAEWHHIKKYLNRPQVKKRILGR